MKDIQELIHTNAHNAYGIGVRTERERILRLLKQLRSQWQEKLSWYLSQDNSYEVSRYRNYILALDDLHDMTADPETFKGENK